MAKETLSGCKFVAKNGKIEEVVINGRFKKSNRLFKEFENDVIELSKTEPVVVNYAIVEDAETGKVKRYVKTVNTANGTTHDHVVVDREVQING